MRMIGMLETVRSLLCELEDKETVPQRRMLERILDLRLRVDREIEALK